MFDIYVNIAVNVYTLIQIILSLSFCCNWLKNLKNQWLCKKNRPIIFNFFSEIRLKIRGKEMMHGKSGDTVNRGPVNRGLLYLVYRY